MSGKKNLEKKPPCKGLGLVILQNDVNPTSSRRHKTDFFKTLQIRRLQDVVNPTSSRRCKSDVFKASQIRCLLPDVLRTSGLVVRRRDLFKTSWRCLKDVCVRWDKPSCKTNIYGKNSIVVSAINAWNNSHKLLKISLRHLSTNKINKILSDVFFAKRWNELSTFRCFRIDAFVLTKCMRCLWHHFCHWILYFLCQLCQLNFACQFLS